MTIKGLKNRIISVDTDKIAVESVTETTEEIRKYNLKQMLDGKTSSGVDITPTYLTDPFFKTPEAALRYSKWKDELSPASNRKSGVPNFYINGFYHNSVEVKVEGEKIVTKSNTLIGKKIEAKQPELYGLSPESRSVFIPFVLRPRFNAKMRLATGLKFSTK
jgi:hypothetical protein